MRHQLVIEHHRDLLATAERRRAIRQARQSQSRTKWRLARRWGDSTVFFARRPTVVATSAPTPCP